MPTPDTLSFINTVTHTNTNKYMTFELLNVCRPANPAWIELRVMYVRSTVANYLFFLFLYFVLSFIFFLPFLHISLFRFAFIGFVDFVSHFIGAHVSTWRLAKVKTKKPIQSRVRISFKTFVYIINTRMFIAACNIKRKIISLRIITVHTRKNVIIISREDILVYSILVR